jgi:hypothetical protein
VEFQQHPHGLAAFEAAAVAAADDDAVAVVEDAGSTPADVGNEGRLKVRGREVDDKRRRLCPGAPLLSWLPSGSILGANDTCDEVRERLASWLRLAPPTLTAVAEDAEVEEAADAAASAGRAAPDDRDEGAREITADRGSEVDMPLLGEYKLEVGAPNSSKALATPVVTASLSCSKYTYCGSRKFSEVQAARVLAAAAATGEAEAADETDAAVAAGAASSPPAERKSSLSSSQSSTSPSVFAIASATLSDSCTRPLTDGMTARGAGTGVHDATAAAADAARRDGIEVDEGADDAAAATPAAADTSFSPRTMAPTSAARATSPALLKAASTWRVALIMPSMVVMPSRMYDRPPGALTACAARPRVLAGSSEARYLRIVLSQWLRHASTRQSGKYLRRMLEEPLSPSVTAVWMTKLASYSDFTNPSST